MRIVKSALKATPLGVFAATSLCAAVLSGCTTKASADAAVVPNIVPLVEKMDWFGEIRTEDFTAVGKQTKLVEAPWGLRPVYDPFKDAELRRIFEEYVYLATQNVPVDVKRKDNLLGAIETAERASWNDLTRQGCVVKQDNLCLLFDDQPRYSRIDCRKFYVMGSAERSDCEIENQAYKDGVSLSGFRLTGRDLTTCRFNKNPEFKLQLRDTAQLKRLNPSELFALYFDRTCKGWAHSEKYYSQPINPNP